MSHLCPVEGCGAEMGPRSDLCSACFAQVPHAIVMLLWTHQSRCGFAYRRLVDEAVRAVNNRRAGKHPPLEE